MKLWRPVPGMYSWRVEDSQSQVTLIPNLHAFSLPTPYSVGNVNVYLLEPTHASEPMTLLDAGPNWEPSEKALRHSLAQRGYSVKNLERILISHPHPDHYGLVGKLAAESGATVHAHPASRSTLETGDSNGQRADTFYREWLSSNGVPVPIQKAIALARDDTHHHSLPVQLSGTLNEGDEFRAGGLGWRVLATPGHSGGLICFYQSETGVLLSSDHLIGGISSNPVIEPPCDGELERPKRLLQYLFHLERVAALRPTIALSGHGSPIHDVPGLVKERIAFHQQRAEKLWRQMEGGPWNLFELTQRLFRSTLPPIHQFLALSEVQGHLDLLEAAGRAECSTDGSILRWFAIE